MIDFYDGDLVNPAASQVEPAVGRRHHVAHRPAARRDQPTLKRLALGVEGDNGVGSNARFAVPDCAVGG